MVRKENQHVQPTYAADEPLVNQGERNLPVAYTPIAIKLALKTSGQGVETGTPTSQKELPATKPTRVQMNRINKQQTKQWGTK